MAVPMDWMYKRPTVDTEAYLLGKPIDKSLEQLENPDGCPTSNEDLGGKPGALFVEAAASAALEAEAKLRQDPLYIIKKKEEEQRRMLLNNPVRLKKLQEELERQKQKEEKKNKSGSDHDILAKMLKIKAKYGTDMKNLLSEDLVSSSSSSKRHERHHDHHRRRSRSRSPARESRRRKESSHSHEKSSRHERRSDSRERYRVRSPHSARDSRPASHHQRKASTSPRRRSNSPRHSATGNESLKNSYHSSQSSSAAVPKKASLPEKRPRQAATSSKFDPAELERKRLEMMSDAKIRDGERAKNLSDHRKRTAADAEEQKKIGAAGSDGFIRPMLDTVAQSGTLESRLKASRHKSQRTRAALDKNFTER